LSIDPAYLVQISSTFNLS